MSKPGRKARPNYERRLREETVYINRVPVIFFRCPKKRRWCWRAIGARVKVPVPPPKNSRNN